MDHRYIEDHNIVARYEMSRLSEAECALFEEHFVDCAECQQQLAAAGDFRQALQTAAAKDTSISMQASLAVVPGGLSSKTISGWRILAAVAAVLVVALGLTVLFLTREIRLAHSELAQTKAAGDHWQHKYNQASQSNTDMEKRLSDAQKPQEKNAGSGSTGIQIKVPALASIFALNTVRGGENGDGPVNWVLVSQAQPWIILSPDWADAQSISNYRATLSDASGHVLWKENQQTPVSSPQFGITISSALLHEGDYVFSLEAHSKQSGEAITHRYPFHAKVIP